MLQDVRPSWPIAHTQLLSILLCAGPRRAPRVAPPPAPCRKACACSPAWGEPSCSGEVQLLSLLLGDACWRRRLGRAGNAEEASRQLSAPHLLSHSPLCLPGCVQVPHPKRGRGQEQHSRGGARGARLQVDRDALVPRGAVTLCRRVVTLRRRGVERSRRAAEHPALPCPAMQCNVAAPWAALYRLHRDYMIDRHPGKFGLKT